MDAVMFCNEHGLPYSTSVGIEAAAAMAAILGRLRSSIRVPFGVNLLWDPRASLAVARATGAAFVREVFTGVFESDIHLQQTDSGADHHWPFTSRHNAVGRIDAGRVLSALGKAKPALIIEAIPPFEADDSQVLGDLRETVAYWRAALAKHSAVSLP